MSRSPVPASRRTAIALALAVPIVLTACEFDPPSAAPSDAATTAPPLPDTEVVAAARKAILLMLATVESTTTTHPRLRAELGAWLDLHGAHLAVLDDTGDDQSVDQTVEPALIDPRARAARQAVVSAEGALAVTLADSASQAASGDLARALASMSAGILQRLIP